jgi:serine/threonine protein kinase
VLWLLQEMRQQMLRDIKILSDAQDVPGLLSFLGAYLVQDRDQVRAHALAVVVAASGLCWHNLDRSCTGDACMLHLCMCTVPQHTALGCGEKCCLSPRLQTAFQAHAKSTTWLCLVCMQMAVVLEYMDGGTLADVLNKVSY